MSRVAVVGNTGWGRTIASLLLRNATDVCLVTRSESETELLRHRGVEYRVSHVATEALEGSDYVVWAVPSQTMRANVTLLRDILPTDVCHVSVAKGLEVDSGKRMTEVVLDVLGFTAMRGMCALSGPNLAEEISRGLPAASVVASSSPVLAQEVQSLFSSPRFVTVVTDDVIGVELAGALKNVVAIGAGMMDGLGLGDNAKAAFIAFTWSEVIAFGVALGARESTFYGVAGFGDVVATCVSNLSRNHFVGCEIARGRRLHEVLETMHQVAEGVHTAKAVYRLSNEVHIAAPIMISIYRALFEGYPVGKAVARFTGQVQRGR
ncbi:MAG: NAD(P)-dependent glycerol-3-phosphate dehydrogenase [Dehalococcoidia bacterium]|nr:NAD(P)-dependent glycerol-3-phosphate dehydrogenase [Dehalococcoidia bacterium]